MTVNGYLSSCVTLLKKWQGLPEWESRAKDKHIFMQRNYKIIESNSHKALLNDG